MRPNDATDLKIFNRRPDRLTGSLIVAGLCCMWVVWFGVRTSGLLDRLYRPEIDLYTLGSLTCVGLALAYRYQAVRHWKLGAGLTLSSGQRYRPADILEIAFAPDSAEDYDDSPARTRMCFVRARLRWRAHVNMVISDRDAQWVRAWADRHGIPVRGAEGVGSADN